MNITAQCVASFHYTLKNDDGQTLDTSSGQAPLSYLHGEGNIVPGLEKEMSGKSTGDKFSVTVSPSEGYGEYDDNLKQTLPRDMFSGVDTVEVGMEFHAQTQHGKQVVAVVDVSDEGVTVDGNHPLAGQNLHFDIEITEVREATKDELDHGHVHGPGCNH